MDDKPFGLTQMTATTTHDGMRNVIVVLALDNVGRLWSRLAEPGAPWVNLDKKEQDVRSNA